MLFFSEKHDHLMKVTLNLFSKSSKSSAEKLKESNKSLIESVGEKNERVLKLKILKNYKSKPNKKLSSFHSCLTAKMSNKKMEQRFFDKNLVLKYIFECKPELINHFFDFSTASPDDKVKSRKQRGFNISVK